MLLSLYERVEGENVKKMYIGGCVFLLKPEDYEYLNLTVK